MAERRMFAKTIIDSDLFLDMPMSTQLLYFHLAMRADDDGFVNSPKKIQRIIGGSDDDIKILISKQFIIPFESGVVVIKHWKIHNYLRSDRYHPSMRPEKKLLVLDENKVYQMSTTGIPDNIPNDIPTVDIGKVRLGKVREDNNILPDKSDSVVISSESQKKSDKNQFESDFEECWKIYPNKQGKAQARKVYLKLAKKDPDLKEKVISGINKYIENIRKNNTGQQYIKHGSTYFNNECWNDEYDMKVSDDDEYFYRLNPDNAPF